ncbi:MAG: hypothetical protein MJ066_01080 [Clostridia bacterium]|nr:hypothetical protein [Clostridia bacterium]
MIKYFNPLKESFLAIFLLVFAIIFAVGGYSYAVGNGIKLWVATILTSLFPYFFISAFLSSLSITGKLSLRLSPLTKKLFNANGLTGYAFIMSILSGYPTGAKTVSDLKERGLISDIEAIRASAFCSTSSPMFMFGSVGCIMFCSQKFGIALFLTHIISAFTCAVIFSFYKRREKATESKTVFVTSDSIIYDSTYSAVISVLIVGGLITIFYVLIEILSSLGFLNPIINFINIFVKNENISSGIVYGLLENTRGLQEISKTQINALSFCTSCLLCGFGGISIIAQSIAYLKKAKIKIAPFLVAKILHAILNVLFGFVFYLIFF